MKESDLVWVVWGNTDNTEGRGQRYVLAVCKIEATAIRIAKGKYVMGGDCPITLAKSFKLDGQLYVPGSLATVLREDEDQQELINQREKAKEKALQAGLSLADIEALGWGGSRR